MDTGVTQEQFEVLLAKSSMMNEFVATRANLQNAVSAIENAHKLMVEAIDSMKEFRLISADLNEDVRSITKSVRALEKAVKAADSLGLVQRASDTEKLKKFKYLLEQMDEIMDNNRVW